jgi:hypothetical protein
MYRDQGKFQLDLYPNRFRDMQNQNFVQIIRINGAILISSFRELDGEGVYVFITDYEANQMMLHLQKLLNEN